MKTISRNLENPKPSKPNRFIFNLTHKWNIKRSDKYIVLSERTIHYTCDNMKSYKNTHWYNPPIQIYADNNFNNVITFITEVGYILELLTPESKKLFWSNKKQ